MQLEASMTLCPLSTTPADVSVRPTSLPLSSTRACRTVWSNNGHHLVTVSSLLRLLKHWTARLKFVHSANVWLHGFSVFLYFAVNQMAKESMYVNVCGRISPRFHSFSGLLFVCSPAGSNHSFRFRFAFCVAI